MSVAQVLDDLLAEQEALDAVVASLDAEQFALDTPSPRWTIADQIGHLTYFDERAALAIVDPAAFSDHRDELRTAFRDDLAVDDATLGVFRTLEPPDLLMRWRHARLDLESAARQLDDDSRVEWYGPSMGAKSFLTARLMEVWAHGQDIVDTIADNTGATDGVRPPTDRLRHIAQLGYITRSWSYVVRGDEPPKAPVRVELTAPSGETWTWGPDDAVDQVIGPAADFCLVVTQRRHVDDTGLITRGPLATEWMRRAQAFAGGPTEGPPSRSTT